MINDNVFKAYEEKYPHIKVTNNILLYEGKKIDLKDISLKEILDRDSVTVLEEENLVHLIEIEKMAKETLENEQTMLEKAKESNPVIKNLALIELEKNGQIKKYVHYIDEHDRDHILYNYVPTDVLSIYKNLLQTQNGIVTEHDLYSALERKMKDVNLEVSYASSSLNEEFAQEIKHHEEEINRKGSYAKKNDEHEILVSNHKIYSTYKDEEGNLHRSTNEMINNNETNVAVENTKQENIYQEEMNEEEKVLFISEREFYILLSLDRKRTEEEEKQVELYYAFLYDIMTYQNYLSEEVLMFLNHYNQYLNQLQLLADMRDGRSLNENEQNALFKRNELYEKLESQDRNYNKDNILKLTKTLPKVGYVDSFVLLILTIVGGYFLALAMIFLK